MQYYHATVYSHTKLGGVPATGYLIRCCLQSMSSFHALLHFFLFQECFRKYAPIHTMVYFIRCSVWTGSDRKKSTYHTVSFCFLSGKITPALTQAHLSTRYRLQRSHVRHQPQRSHRYHFVVENDGARPVSRFPRVAGQAPLQSNSWSSSATEGPKHKLGTNAWLG